MGTHAEYIGKLHDLIGTLDGLGLPIDCFLFFFRNEKTIEYVSTTDYVIYNKIIYIYIYMLLDM